MSDPIGTILRRGRGEEWEVGVHVHHNDTSADRWDTEPDEIRGIPWEVLHDGASD